MKKLMIFLAAIVLSTQAQETLDSAHVQKLSLVQKLTSANNGALKSTSNFAHHTIQGMAAAGTTLALITLITRTAPNDTRAYHVIAKFVAGYIGLEAFYNVGIILDHLEEKAGIDFPKENYVFSTILGTLFGAFYGSDLFLKSCYGHLVK